MDPHTVTPDHVPVEWPSAATDMHCTCTKPQPQVQAARKGAARTTCASCGLPIRIDFGERR